jgi:hypothetical protein
MAFTTTNQSIHHGTKSKKLGVYDKNPKYHKKRKVGLKTNNFWRPYMN